MAHKVRFAIPRRELGNANIEFLVYQDGAMFGKLLVSKGAVVWRKKSKSIRSWKLGWSQFDKFMQGNGRSIRGG
jgi:hypothetical protein